MPDKDNSAPNRTAFLFDLDGTLVDSVYQHVLAWREALEAGGIHLAISTKSACAALSKLRRAS